jgi:hypothetical protein
MAETIITESKRICNSFDYLIILTFKTSAKQTIEKPILRE